MNFKKSLAVVLALSIVSGAATMNSFPVRMSFTANANAGYGPFLVSEQIIKDDVQTEKRKCGDNLDWELDSNGTLTITGTGDMYDTNMNGSPWWSERNSIRKVVIGDNVTSIGNWMFYSCANLSSVVWGKSVSAIGSYAFDGCVSLTSVNIPDSVTTMQPCIFVGCKNLMSVILPDSITSIGGYTFSGCTALNYIVIPASVTTVHPLAFEGTPFSSISFEEGDIGPWTYCTKLPADISSSDSRLQYREYSTAVAKASPGDGWVQGSLNKSVYEDSGGPYESDIELPTSETRVLLSYYYYHFCSGAKGNEANYGFNDVFNHWDALNANDVYEVQTGLDSADNRYRYYYLKWKGTDNWAYCRSGVSCDGSYGSHGDRCFVWYRRSTYQDKVKVDYYNYTKDSGKWSEIKPASGLVSVYRYNSGTTPVTTTTTTVTTSTTTTKATTSGVGTTSTSSTTSRTTSTTTTKKTTTTTTTAAVTTTTTTTTTPVVTSIRFVDSINNWSFNNSSKNFCNYGYGYYIDDEYYSKLRDGLSNAEKVKIRDERDLEWGGSCYGMAATSILSCYGILDPSKYQSGANFLHDITGPPTREEVSLINYYYLLQFTDAIQQNYSNALMSLEKQKIINLISQIESKKPTLITYYWKADGEWHGHAIVGYDIQYGSFVKNKKPYNIKIVTYDNRVVGLDDDYCMYINTSSYTWTLPHDNADSEKKDMLGSTFNDISLINNHGYLSGSNNKTYENFIPTLESTAIKSDFSLRKVNLTSNGSYTYASGDENDFVSFAPLTADPANHTLNYAMGGSTTGCIFDLNESQSISISMRYENDLLLAKSGDSSVALFDPSGFVKTKGARSEYELSVVSNDGYAPTSWYQMTASGEGAEVIFYKTEGGYILKSDELKNVTLSAESDEHNPSCTFSTDMNEVFIYEIDEDTIGVAIDSDDNGTYETSIETKSVENSILGDPNNDEKVDAKDASMILVAYAKASTGSEDGLTDVQCAAADVNADGKVDAKDASSILAYYALVSTASGDIPSMKEFMTTKQT